MRFSILVIGCLFCAGIDRTYGGLFGGAPAVPAVANPLPAANPIGASPLGGAGGVAQGAQLLNAMPDCDAPIDHSCDNMQMSDMANQIGGGNLLGGPMGALLGGGRRRRRLAGLAGGLSPNTIVPGAAAASSPMFTDQIAGKMKTCDDQEKQKGPFAMDPNQLNSLASGNFGGITDPTKIDAGKQCKQMMDTNKDNCQMMKRQCCAFMKGTIQPTQLNCAFKDIMQTQAKVKAKDTACETASSVLSNPSNAGGAIQGAMPGMAAAGAMQAISGKGR